MILSNKEEKTLEIKIKRTLRVNLAVKRFEDNMGCVVSSRSNMLRYNRAFRQAIGVEFKNFENFSEKNQTKLFNKDTFMNIQLDPVFPSPVGKIVTADNYNSGVLSVFNKKGGSLDYGVDYEITAQRFNDEIIISSKFFSLVIKQDKYEFLNQMVLTYTKTEYFNNEYQDTEDDDELDE